MKCDSVFCNLYDALKRYSYLSAKNKRMILILNILCQAMGKICTELNAEPFKVYINNFECIHFVVSEPSRLHAYRG